MSRGGSARAWPLALASLAALTAAGDDGSGLSLADLAPYRAALERPAAGSGPAVPVTFRALWDHPGRYEGRRVRVEGRVARRFRQGALGTFPPLVEVWAVSPAGDPFCLVYAAPAPPAAGPDPAPGASVRFEGTYLKRLRYRGGDADRLAPLIVGDRPPAVTTPAPPRGAAEPEPEPARGSDPVAWAFGLVCAGFVALALARRHLSGPPRRLPRPERDLDPPPEFLDGA